MTKMPQLKYKAFISYSHTADQRFAPALQEALEILEGVVRAAKDPYLPGPDGPLADSLHLAND